MYDIWEIQRSSRFSEDFWIVFWFNAFISKIRTGDITTLQAVDASKSTPAVGFP